MYHYQSLKNKTGKNKSSLLLHTNLSSPHTCATYEASESIDDLNEAKNSFNHTDDQENREEDNIPKDDVFRLFANTPCCLVKQIIVSMIEENNWQDIRK